MAGGPHLGDPVPQGVDDAADHHLGEDGVRLQGLLVGDPVVLGRVSQDLEQGPSLRQRQRQRRNNERGGGSTQMGALRGNQWRQAAMDQNPDRNEDIARDPWPRVD